jgi:cob(I)alamin adenosyltransferase
MKKASPKSTRKGFVHVYTGDGKGKTTAAMGLALRAAGAGMRVYIAQFLKRGRFSEVRAMDSLKGVTLEQFGRPSFVRMPPTEDDRRSARWGLAAVAAAMTGGHYDVVVADELCTAIAAKVISVDAAEKLLAIRPASVELVLTGRGAPARILRAADLVTEMRPLKHYFTSGIKARKGIEY